MNDDSTRTSAGVQALIGRLRDEGVQAGRAEAERLLADARREAKRLLDEARAEADAVLSRARTEASREREAAVAALRLAERDTVLELRQGIAHHFERHVRRLVSRALLDEELVRSLLLVLAGQAASDFLAGREADVRVARALFLGEAPHDPAAAAEADARLRDFILGVTGQMLREGMELVPADDLGAGVQVRLRNEHAELDLSDEAVSALLVRHLLPRFQALLSGAEDAG